jgi:hypothetical protein
MYYVIVAAFMLVLPVASVVIEIRHGALVSAALIGRWFVFWGVGVRLLLAGLRQMLQPGYTAETIFGIKDRDAQIVVRELGFANTAIGTIGVATLVAPGWTLPAAIAGAIFYGLAGLNHLRQDERNRLENVAMISDLFIAVVLAGCTAAALVG